VILNIHECDTHLQSPGDRTASFRLPSLLYGFQSVTDIKCITNVHLLKHHALITGHTNNLTDDLPTFSN